ncbi:MAG TPA: HAD hydrolase-like protein [Acidimicrobiia bacterium]|nr:HAD hydrolase-like protein [Acidimicrobiia bacterium]
MADPRFEVILFDIDGTLITTGGASGHAWAHAVRDFYDVDFDVDKQTGKGLPDPEVGREVLRAVLDREPTGRELLRLMRRRMKYLPGELENAPHFVVEPGVPELLEKLTEADLLLGLTTGNVEPAAHAKLARAGLNHYFSFGGYGSDATERVELTKRAIERARRLAGEELPNEVIMSLGDTPRDVEAGHGAGIRVTGVATGEYSVAELTDAGADWAVETLEAGLPGT